MLLILLSELDKRKFARLFQSLLLVQKLHMSRMQRITAAGERCAWAYMALVELIHTSLIYYSCVASNVASIHREALVLLRMWHHHRIFPANLTRSGPRLETHIHGIGLHLGGGLLRNRELCPVEDVDRCWGSCLPLLILHAHRTVESWLLDWGRKRIVLS